MWWHLSKMRLLPTIRLRSCGFPRDFHVMFTIHLFKKKKDFYRWFIPVHVAFRHDSLTWRADFPRTWVVRFHVGFVLWQNDTLTLWRDFPAKSPVIYLLHKWFLGNVTHSWRDTSYSYHTSRLFSPVSTIRLRVWLLTRFYTPSRVIFSAFHAAILPCCSRITQAIPCG